MLGALFTFIYAFPLFWLLDTKDPGTVMIAIIIGVNLGHALMFAPESSYFPELFKGPVRCTGASFGFQVSAAVGGGLAPIIATGLLDHFGTTTGVSIMMIGFGIVTLAAAIFARETKHETL
jgi:MFS transporter, MHS family, shikimate and dehydroshikimate transport protein